MMFYAVTTGVITYYLIGIVFFIATLCDMIRKIERREDVCFDECSKRILVKSFLLWPYVLIITVLEPLKNMVINFAWNMTHRGDRDKKKKRHKRVLYKWRR